jgi:hypothetical protein
MSYQLSNFGASIEIASEAGKKLVIKNTVTEVSVVRGTIIKVSTGNPLQIVYLNHHDVIVPSTATPIVLRDTINAWIGE